MKRFVSFAAVALLLNVYCIAQTSVLFSENFESGSAGAFTLNPAENGCVTDATGYNKWIVNNVYAGGAGSLFCFFTINYAIANTVTQPGAITNSPTSYYMHILSDEAQADNILCSSFLAADGFCNFSQSHFTRMTNDISTVGYSNVTMSFYWLCGGSANGYGSVYYSTDQGLTWTLVTTPVSNYSGQSASWQLATLSLPAWDNQANLRMGFRFTNNQTTSAADPGFCVDEIVIQGTIPATITTGTVSPTTFCPGDPVSVPYTIGGAFNPGNQFDAQLSDATGSFASPQVIGSLVSTSAGTINGTIPLATPPGTGYRIRVVSTNPSVVGTGNGTDLTVLGQPTGGSALAANDSICSGDSTLINLGGSIGNIQWQSSPNGTAFGNMAGQTSGTLNTGVLTANKWYRAIVSNACGADTSNIVSITVFTSPVAGTIVAVPDSVCEGGTSTLSISGNSGTLDWESSNDGITFSTMGLSASSISVGPLVQTQYYQAVSSGTACPDMVSNSVAVTVVPDPVAGFTFSQTGFDANFTNTSTGAASYSWDFGDGGTSVLTDPSHTYSGFGNYQVTLIAYNALGCADTTTQTVSFVQGYSEIQIAGLVVYPNPFTNEIHIHMDEFTGDPIDCSITDVRGREIQHISFSASAGGSDNQTIKVPGELNPGIYFLKITRGNKQQVIRMVKN